MNVTQIVKSQAESQFNRHKQEIIKKIIHKNYKDKPNFQEILNLYLK